MAARRGCGEGGGSAFSAVSAVRTVVGTRIILGKFDYIAYYGKLSQIRTVPYFQIGEVRSYREDFQGCFGFGARSGGITEQSVFGTFAQPTSLHTKSTNYTIIGTYLPKKCPLCRNSEWCSHVPDNDRSIKRAPRGSDRSRRLHTRDCHIIHRRS